MLHLVEFLIEMLLSAENLKPLIELGTARAIVYCWL